MITLIAILALGQIDGGTDVPALEPMVVLDVVEGALVVRPEDGGSPEPRHVGDGCYMPTASCIRAGKEHARKDGELAKANEVGMKWLGVAFAGGAVTGLAIGIVVGIFAPVRK